MATRLPDNSLPVSRGLPKSAPGVLLRRLFQVIEEVYRECGVRSKTFRQQRSNKIRKGGSGDFSTPVSSSIEVPESRIVLSVNGITPEAEPEPQEVVESQVEFVADTIGEGGDEINDDAAEQPEVIDDLEPTKVIGKRHPATASSQVGQNGGDFSGVSLSGDDFTAGIGGSDGLQISQPYPFESESSSFEQQADPGSANDEAVDDEIANELTDDLFSSGAVLDSVLSSSGRSEQLNSRAAAGRMNFLLDEQYAESLGTRTSEFRTVRHLELTADFAAGDQFRDRDTWDSTESTISQIPVDGLSFGVESSDAFGDQSGVTYVGLHQLAAELMLTMGQPIQLFPTMGSDVTLTDVLFDVEPGATIHRDSPISELFAGWIGKLQELPAAGNLLSPLSNNPLAGAKTTGVGSRLTIVSESGIEVNRIRLITVSRQKSWNVESPRLVLPGGPPAETSEFGALDQLTFHMDPRGPPGTQRSDPLKQKIESNADAEQLRRLRYSIAPRGPSLVV